MSGCVIGFADWTHRAHCGRMAACEVRVIHRGHPYAWRAACYRHADSLFAAIAKADRDVWSCEMRPDPVLREVLDYRAEVVTLRGGAER